MFKKPLSINGNVALMDLTINQLKIENMNSDLQHEFFYILRCEIYKYLGKIYVSLFVWGNNVEIEQVYKLNLIYIDISEIDILSFIQYSSLSATLPLFAFVCG